MSEQNEKPNEYKVGRNRPPKHSQWKKGQSGNPKGRPKSKKYGKIDVGLTLTEPVLVKIGDKTSRREPFEVMVRQIARQALQEKPKAIKKFIKLCEKYELFEVLPIKSGGGVIFAPKGISPQEWVNSQQPKPKAARKKDPS